MTRRASSVEAPRRHSFPATNVSDFARSGNAVSRRSALKVLGGTVATALGASACEPSGKRYVVDRTGQRGSQRRFVPVEVDRSRLVRSTVGLRPYRNSGFRLDSERLDGKQLIHCYGHGGGGMTLSWGTSNLAVGLIADHAPPQAVAVLGAGVIGLTTAILLQRLGYDVSIYAATAWPHTTSNASAATFFPSHVVDATRVTPQFTNTFEAALRRSYHAFQRLTGEHYGIRWMDSFSLGDGSATAEPPDFESQVQNRVVGDTGRPLDKREHPFAAQAVSQGRVRPRRQRQWYEWWQACSVLRSTVWCA